MATTTATSMYPEEETRRTPFPLTPPVLGDDFYPFGGERQQSFAGDVVAGEADPEDTDLRVLLQRKEQDLLLAAELGKMLLERNEELGRRYEELAKEHTEAMEVRGVVCSMGCRECQHQRTSGFNPLLTIKVGGGVLIQPIVLSNVLHRVTG